MKRIHIKFSLLLHIKIFYNSIIKDTKDKHVISQVNRRIGRPNRIHYPSFQRITHSLVPLVLLSIICFESIDGETFVVLVNNNKIIIHG